MASRKRTGHYCRICGRHRPNEKFSGQGHANHICGDCAQRPQAELQFIDERREIGNFLTQSNISKDNLKRLATLAASPNLEIARIAKLVWEIGKVCPHKRNRLQKLSREYGDLKVQLEETGLIYACQT